MYYTVIKILICTGINAVACLLFPPAVVQVDVLIPFPASKTYNVSTLPENRSCQRTDVEQQK